MKKTLWMLGVAVAAMTSCTQSEVVDVPESRVISFDSHIDKTTRAATLIQQQGAANNDLNKFWVYGIEGTNNRIFDPQLVTYSGTGFSYTTPKTWNTGQTYNFAAYSNANNIANGTSTISGGSTLESVEYELVGQTGSKLTFNNYKVGTDDLLAAIVSPIAIDETGSNIPQSVSLNFQHLLSCVRITLTNSSETLYLKIADITFNAIGTDDCEYEVSNSSKTIKWSNMQSPAQTVSAEKNYSFTDGDVYIAPGGFFQDMCFFIPQSNNIAITITAETYERTGTGQNYTYTKKSTKSYPTTLAIIDTDNTDGVNHACWQPGYQYQYAADIGGTVHYIRFTATIDNFDPHPAGIGGTNSTDN